MRSLRAGVAVFVVLCGSVIGAARPQNPAGTRADALGVFDERLAAYAALHQRLETSLAPMTPTGDIRSLFLASESLAFAIRTARPNARQGDIFTPAVADVLRRVIGEALDGVDREALLRDLYLEDDVPPGYQPRVYDSYPRWATHEMPVVVLHRLPLLPKDIAYRLVDHALVLWDIHADLIVDVLPDAIARPSL
ncbi:MAG TPA: hypothetical protein VI485_19235 [Vicinamibacterales bacterium]|nr:hypothetical protein [Vicinamibacterales bacterium]